MKKAIIGVAVLLFMCLCACGGKQHTDMSAKQQSNQGNTGNPVSTTAPNQRKTPSAADITDALISAGYLDEDSFRHEYDGDIDAAGEEELANQLSSILKKKGKTALLLEDHFYNVDEMFDIQPKRGLFYQAFTAEDIRIEEPCDIIIYCKFSSINEADSECNRIQEEVNKAGSDEYSYWGSKIDTIWVSAVEDTLVLYIGRTNSAATKALKNLGY